MKNKRDRKMVRRLEQELPYPKLTIQAELKFDEILAMLPEKKASAQKAEVYEGAHFKKGKHGKHAKPAANGAEASENVVYLEPVTYRRSVPRTIAKFALAAAAICLVSLVLLRLPSLGALRSQPGAGQSVLSTPVFPKETAYTVMIESAVQKGNYLFQTVRLEFSEDTCPKTEQLFTSLTDEYGINVSVDGTPSMLYRDPVFEKVAGKPAFEGKVISVLPEYPKIDAQAGERVTATVSIDRLLGITSGQRQDPYADPDICLSGSVVSSSAEVTSDASYELGEEGLFTSNGITLLGYTSNENEFTLNLSYPAMNQAEPYVFVRTAEDDAGLECLYQGEQTGDTRELGARVGKECTFAPLPEDTSQVTVIVFDHDPNQPYVYVNGEMSFPVVLSEFTIYLDSGTVYETGSSLGQFSDQSWFVPLSRYATVMEAGLRFDQHILAAGWGISNIGGLGFDSEMALHLLAVSDLNADLPLEIEMYVNSECVETLPTYRNAATDVIDENMYRVAGRYGRLDVSLAGEFETFEADGRERNIRAVSGVSQMRQYAYTLDSQALTEDWGGIDNSLEIVLRNPVTGEILASTCNPLAEDSINAYLDVIGTKEELLWKRDFIDPLSGTVSKSDTGVSSMSEHREKEVPAEGADDDGSASATPEPYPDSDTIFVDPTPPPQSVPDGFPSLPESSLPVESTLDDTQG